MRKLLWLVSAVIAFYPASAQTNRYVIKFKNKGSNTFSLQNPSAYLSQRSIQRRAAYSVQLDSTDLPVPLRYLDSLRLAGSVTILNVSKWLNQASIFTTDATALAKINQLSFVETVQPMAPRPQLLNQQKNVIEEGAVEIPTQSKPTDIAVYNYGSSYDQIHIHNGEFLHAIGLRGQGMIVGMADAGFLNYLTLKAFDSVRANNQILGTYDFVANETSVNEDHEHGMMCLSTIAANIPGQFIGTSPKASFYLYRSEDAATEYPIEMHNWVCAAEKLDSAGGDVLSSSLGYYNFDSPFTGSSYSYQNMNGNTSPIAIGADLAAKKGMLVVNSAGNEGSNSWHYIVTPADGDSVLAVGAVNNSGVAAGFSSYGPSSDGQVKPDLASVGASTTVALPNNTVGARNGTSFAAPNLAGLVTCLWQGFREFNNIQILNVLRSSGSISTAPNDRIGYGIPDMKKAILELLKMYATSTTEINNCRLSLNWNSKDVSGMKYEIERRLPNQAAYTKIGEQPGMGVDFGNRSYTYVDFLDTVQPGVISYRIRQVIDTSLSGLSSVYIDTIAVNLASRCTSAAAAATIVAGPNPVTSDLTAKIITPMPLRNAVVQLVNAKGQLMYRSTPGIPSGQTLIRINMSTMATGKYYLSLYGEGKLIETKELLKL